MSDERKYFLLADLGARWYVVARDRDHAINLLREQGAEWEVDRGEGDVTELDAEAVAKVMRCHTEDDRGVIPLSEAALGDLFCSEW